MNMNLKIFTDGSCKGNPGPGGWAAILLATARQKPLAVLKGGEEETTNNRMEMIAMIEALRFVQENHSQQSDITLYSDSNLIVQTLSRGWKRKANLDLWEELDSLNEELNVEYVWVEGHAQNKWNNECDKIAVRESAMAKKKLSAENKSAHKKTPIKKIPKSAQGKLF
jgi:ribonuclease HI